MFTLSECKPEEQPYGPVVRRTAARLRRVLGRAEIGRVDLGIAPPQLRPMDHRRAQARIALAWRGRVKM